MFPATANPRSGSAIAPPAMRIPEAPTEKSPDTGSAVWIPRNSVRRMPFPAAAISADGGFPPGAMRRLEIPTVGGAFGPGRRHAPVDPVPIFLPQNASARKPRNSPFAISSRRRVGTPSASNGSAPDPPGSSGSSSIVTASDATRRPTFPANIDFPLATWEARNDGISTSSSSAAAAFSRTTRYSPVFGRTAPSIRSARAAPSSAIAAASSPRSDRAAPNPYPVCPSPFSSATVSTCAEQNDSRRVAANPREWNRETVATVSRTEAVRTRFIRGSRARACASRTRANSPFSPSGTVSTAGSYSGRSAAGPAASGRPCAGSGSEASAQKSASSTIRDRSAASPRNP